MPALTNTAIAAMRPGDRLKDDRVPGLEVRCHPKSKSFLVYYRTRGGEQRRPKIGDCSILSIAQAREIARNLLARVAAGDDPSSDRRTERSAPTMDDLWDRAESEHYNQGKEWDHEAKRMWLVYLKPKLGRLKVASITYDDVKPIHEAMRSTPVSANMALAVLSKMLNLAEKFGAADRKWRPHNSNPCSAVDRYTIRKRKRKAAPEEIAKVGARLRAELDAAPPNDIKPYPSVEAWRQSRLRQVAFIYLLIFSGARPTEIMKLQPGMIERQVIDGVTYGAFSIHGKTTDETGDERRVYLPPQAMDVIDQLPKAGILTRRRKGQNVRTVTGLSRVPREMWERVKPPGMWIRDWRRTFGSVALSNGVTRDQLGELLGHMSQQTTMIYSKLYEAKAATASAVTAQLLHDMLSAGEGGAE